MEADTATLLAQVDEDAARGGYPLDRLAQRLRTAVATHAAEHVTRQALAVHADQGRPARVRCLIGQSSFAEPEGQVLAAVDEPVEG